MLFTAFSITCYRCGGAEASCESSSLETVECADSSIPNAVFACQIYSVNYTTLKGQVLQFKGREITDKSLNSTKRGQNVHHSSIRHFRVSLCLFFKTSLKCELYFQYEWKPILRTKISHLGSMYRTITRVLWLFLQVAVCTRNVTKILAISLVEAQFAPRWQAVNQTNATKTTLLR